MMPRSLNYKHLRYFWMVAKTGSIARASERLHLTPHAVGGQLSQFEQSLGVRLFEREGRKRTLTEAGGRLLDYAERIFSLEDEALSALGEDAGESRAPIAIGIADSLPKSIVVSLLRSVLHAENAPRLICSEGRLPQLVTALALHQLDAVLADRVMPTAVSIRAFSHLLGRSTLSVFGKPALLDQLPGGFPSMLNGAPFLMPGEDVAFRPALKQWFADNAVVPRIIAECDDLALLKTFGQWGEGLFVAPTVVSAAIEAQYGVRRVAELETVLEETYLISTERTLKHPAVRQISKMAREQLFVATAPTA